MNTDNIAKLAGVSKATVSRVLNNRPGVSHDKRTRVLDVVAKIDTRPRIRATKTESDRTGNIAFLIVAEEPFMTSSAAFNSGLKGVRLALAERGLNMVLGHVGRGLKLPPIVEDRGVDGLILAGQRLSSSLEKRLAPIPSVWVTSHREEEGRADVALVGNDKVGRIAADYLIDKGCKLLAFLDLFPANPALITRHEHFAFSAFKANRGVLHLTIEPDGDADLADVTNERAAWAAMERKMDDAIRQATASRKKRPDGMCVPAGDFAGLAYRLLRKHGMEPGRDIQVVVCGIDPPVLASLDPRPAVIDLSNETVGRRAVEQLLSRIENPMERMGTRIIVEPSLIPGAPLPD